MKIAILYDIRDKSTFEELMLHAAPLTRRGVTFVDILHTEISFGKWQEAMRQRIEELPKYDKVIMLLSANFIANDLTYQLSQKLLTDYSGKNYPLLISACDWKRSGFYELLHPDTIPLKQVPRAQRAQYLSDWLNDLEYNPERLLA